MEAQLRVDGLAVAPGDLYDSACAGCSPPLVAGAKPRSSETRAAHALSTMTAALDFPQPPGKLEPPAAKPATRRFCLLATAPVESSSSCVRPTALAAGRTPGGVGDPWAHELTLEALARFHDPVGRGPFRCGPCPPRSGPGCARGRHRGSRRAHFRLALRLMRPPLLPSSISAIHPRSMPGWSNTARPCSKSSWGDAGRDAGTLNGPLGARADCVLDQHGLLAAASFQKTGLPAGAPSAEWTHELAWLPTASACCGLPPVAAATGALVLHPTSWPGNCHQTPFPHRLFRGGPLSEPEAADPGHPRRSGSDGDRWRRAATAGVATGHRCADALWLPGGETTAAARTARDAGAIGVVANQPVARPTPRHRAGLPWPTWEQHASNLAGSGATTLPGLHRGCAPSRPDQERSQPQPGASAAEADLVGRLLLCRPFVPTAGQTPESCHASGTRSLASAAVSAVPRQFCRGTAIPDVYPSRPEPKLALPRLRPSGAVASAIRPLLAC